MNPASIQTQQLRDTLRKDLGSVARDIETLLEHLGETATEQADALKARARDALDGAHAIERQAQSRLDHLGVQAQDYVHRNPWRVVGIAAATAYALGLLTRARH